ncbi:protein ASPARTIC PROTEASE IN GUARD CELL 2-like [Panicum miliaceum]|uniref:Protein ASPARTIC PROTEASE IN GUARD CELL 2-like n=1 Tax=Panicum miliaceum TaxID=4540 RepID=A0A3L6RWV2_PANMI|nr:protein ASPARTIC PROTEASE IN GUARD CELL 2-like [Panicum miliaceum]
MASAFPSLLFCLVLLASPYLGCSYHTSYYTHGGKHYALRSLDLRSLRGEDNHWAPAPAPGPSAPGGAWVSIPVRGDPMESLPGAFEYHVVVGFGTPVQELTVGFDTRTTGATLLKCTPCAATEPCDQAFEPSASSSLAQIPCGSPDCPFRGCSGPSCTLSISMNNTLLGNATFVTDKLTLTSWATVENFRFACMEAGFRPRDDSTGILDLSRNSHSLASRVPSSPDTVAFSYCLPSSAGTVGSLSLGAPKPDLSGHKVSYTPLRSNPGNGNLYVVELVGVGLGGHDLSVPPTAFAGDTIVDLHTTFTYLRPEVYSVLRDNFRQWMTEYKPAPPLGVLDTCYNFTGRNFFAVPGVTLKFNGAADVDLSMNGMMYFPDPGNHFSIACLAFAAAPTTNAREAAVIGNRAQSSMEVVYDVRGGKIGFVPYRC